MRDVHEELAKLKRETDPLATVAARIAQALPADLLRRVPCLRHRRRDDPRAPVRRAVHARRRVRADVELSARGPVSERAAARELPAVDRAAAPLARRDRGRRRHRLPVADARAGERLPHAGGRRGRTRRWRAMFDAMASGPDENADARHRGPDDACEAARGQRDLVRLRGAVRRAALAARLPRARAALRGDARVRRPEDGPVARRMPRAGSPGWSTSCTIIA